jgi:hypothetical protein
MISMISRSTRTALLAAAIPVVATGCAIPLFDEHPERLETKTVNVSPNGKIRIVETDWRHPSGVYYTEYTGINGHNKPACMQVITSPRSYREYWERDFSVPVQPGASVKLYEFDHGRVSVDVSSFIWVPRFDGRCHEQDRPSAS